MTQDRADLRTTFLRSSGWADAALSPLAGDASFRRYFRLQRGEQRAVLMDAPPPHEDVRPFVRIARHLASLGFSTPQIFAEDDANGFLLIEDFGDDTYTRLLATGADETGLYRLAVDVLIALHAIEPARAIPQGVNRYESETMSDLAGYLVDWYLPYAGGRPANRELADEYRALWRQVLPALDATPRTLVLRDFHVDNLMVLPGRSGIAACGLLDFQDAARGATAYDLVSLLEDARRDINPTLREAMLSHYMGTIPVALRPDFQAACALAAAQRHSRVIGQFARLKLRDGKPGYLRHLPRLWRLFERALQHEQLTPVRRWLDRHVPPALRPTELRVEA